MLQDERPCDQFIGWFIPAKIVFMLRDGHISPREMILLANIDGMVDRRGEPCWASNKTLAKDLGCSEEQLRKMLGHLKQLKLIRQVGFNGRRRLLETAWSNIDASVGLKPHAGRGKSPTRPVTTLRDNKQKESGVSSKRLTPEDQMFFETVGSATSQAFIEITKKFREAVNQKTRRLARWKISTQSKHFDKLARAVKDEQLVYAVVQWYVEQLGQTKEQRLPLCSSPSQFVKQWDWIRDRYEDHLEQTTPVEISDEANAIAERLLRRHWPKGSEKDVPLVIQRSLDNSKAFSKKLRQYKQMLSNKPKAFQTRTLIDLIQNKLFHAMLVENWLDEVHGGIENWKEWNGDLRRYILEIKSKRFRQLAHQVITSYGRDANEWDTLLEKMNESPET